MTEQEILNHFNLSTHNITNRLLFLGRLVMRHGNLIIHSQDPSLWKSICYHSSSDVYICFDNVMQLIDPSKEWYPKWFGQKYHQGKLVYEGEFNIFDRHSPEEDAKQVVYADGNVVEVYVGRYQAERRHSLIGVCYTRDKKYVGRWEHNNKQGPHEAFKRGLSSLNRPRQKIKMFDVVNFYNNCQTTTLKKTLSPQLENIPFNDQLMRFNECLSYSLYMSLEDGCWMESSAVDFFFKHLDKSYRDYPSEGKRNIRILTVAGFERMIDSSNVNTNKEIKYEELSSFGLACSSISSIFQTCPILLFPLNKDRSHFALGAIVTQTKRKAKGDTLSWVRFSIWHLDSLYSGENFVPNHLKTFIKKEIQQHILDPSEKKIYLKALDEYKLVEHNTEVLNVSRQENSDDCGVFTCMYGALVALEQGLSYKVNWSNLSTSIPLLRKFIQQDILKQNKLMLSSLIQLLTRNKVLSSITTSTHSYDQHNTI